MTLQKFIWMLDAAKPILLQIEAASPSVGADGRALTREQSERMERERAGGFYFEKKWATLRTVEDFEALLPQARRRSPPTGSM